MRLGLARKDRIKRRTASVDGKKGTLREGGREIQQRHIAHKIDYYLARLLRHAETLLAPSTDLTAAGAAASSIFLGAVVVEEPAAPFIGSSLT